MDDKRIDSFSPGAEHASSLQEVNCAVTLSLCTKHAILTAEGRGIPCEGEAYGQRTLAAPHLLVGTQA